MAEFSCEVVRCIIEPHPNADQIEICRVGDFQSIVRKGDFSNGDLAIYIPEQAVVPEWLLKTMNMWEEERQKGHLHGAAGNRVKAIRLRGIVSQGLMLNFADDNGVKILPVPGEHPDLGVCFDFTPFPELAEGQNFAEYLGIVKYEPLIPSHMRGKIVGVDFEATHGYDFENLKKTPNLFDDGEIVVITEKIHGTLMCIGVVPTSHSNDKYYDRRVIITSKGMGRNGFVLDHNDEGNLYAQAAKKHGLLDKAKALYELADEHDKPVLIFGEVFGMTLGGGTIQDLTYTDEPIDYAAFDICVGNRGSEFFLNWGIFEGICSELAIPMVPVLYAGPYSKEQVLACTDGNTTLSSKKQIREGVVVKSAYESRNPHFGRKIAKSVSDAYLTRKGNITEFN
jgi:RNA ligase (TIGR02306 family)